MAPAAVEPAPASSLVMVDGSQGEGGGQVVRNAVAYAALLGIGLRITNIRAGRRPPGLRAQHVASLELAASLGGGTLEGAAVGSTDLTYRPGRHAHAGTVRFRADTGTAGSVCLLLQAALPCALFFQGSGDDGVIELVLRGGTNASLAPQYDYWERVLVPTLRRRCVPPPLAELPSSSPAPWRRIEGRVFRRGFYPRGGGEVVVRVIPLGPTQVLSPIRLAERGNGSQQHLTSVSVRAFHAGTVPRPAAERMADAAVDYLRRRAADPGGFGCPDLTWKVEVATESHAVGSGGGILLVAEAADGCLFAGSALLAAPKPRRSSKSLSGPKGCDSNLDLAAARTAGHDAARELCEAWNGGGCVDSWLQDQLILYMALADGTSELLVGSLTRHTQTAIAVAEQVAGAAFEVERLRDAPAGAGGGSASSGGAAPSEAAPYGSEGCIPGRHLIRCRGVGFRAASRPPL